MHGLEHVLFFFYFAGGNSMRGIEHILFFFYSREKILCVYDFIHFLFWKKIEKQVNP